MKKLKILWLFASLLWGEEFMISYGVKLQNDRLSGESYKVSKVIDPKGSRGLLEGSFVVIKTCRFILDQSEEINLTQVLRTQKERVLECLYSAGVSLNDEATTWNLQTQSRTILRIPPRRVIAKIEDGVLSLKVLEKQ